MKLFLPFILAICATFSSLSPATAQAPKPLLDANPDDWTIETLAEGLDYPWDIVSDGTRLIVTEKGGNIVLIKDGQVRKSPVHTSVPLRTAYGAGLLGIALSPDFLQSGNAFLYYSYQEGSQLANRVVSVHFDGEKWQETGVILDNIPGHRLYNGGRIAIGPDHHLYITTGWTENYDLPQSTDSLAGKVLRLTLEGQIPADNPIAGSAIYSLGHRNPQGLAWNEKNELFVSEHGQAALDEINLVQPGGNYGWPHIQGDETRAGMLRPFIHSGHDTWAPSGIAFAGDELLVATLKGHGLYVADFETRQLRPLISTQERYRQVLVSGNDIFLITTNRSPRGQGPSKDRLIHIRR